jgi:signal peptidase II
VILLIVALAAVDQIIKYIVVLYLKPIGSLNFINGFVEFRYIENTGAAFGIFANMTMVFSVMTLIICGLMLYFVFTYKKHNFITYTSSIMIIAGGIGNLIDRIFRGFVVDYIHVMFFDYIFNFADCLVTVGVVLLLVYLIFFYDKNKKKLHADGDKTDG